MTRTTKNDIKIDIMGFLKELVGIEEQSNGTVTLVPELRESLERIEEIEKGIYPDNKSTKKRDRTKIEQIEKVEVTERSIDDNIINGDEINVKSQDEREN